MHRRTNVLTKSQGESIGTAKISLKKWLSHFSHVALFHFLYVTDLFLRGGGVRQLGSAAQTFVKDSDVTESLRGQLVFPQTELEDVTLCSGPAMVTRLFFGVALCLLWAGACRGASCPGIPSTSGQVLVVG